MKSTKKSLIKKESNLIDNLEHKGAMQVPLTPDQMVAISHIKSAYDATTHSAQQFALIVEDYLLNELGMSETDLKKMRDYIEKIIKVVKVAEGSQGLSILSPEAMRTMGEIAQRNELKEQAANSGISLPTNVISKLIKN